MKDSLSKQFKAAVKECEDPTTKTTFELLEKYLARAEALEEFLGKFDDQLPFAEMFSAILFGMDPNDTLHGRELKAIAKVFDELITAKLELDGKKTAALDRIMVNFQRPPKKKNQNTQTLGQKDKTTSGA